MTLSSQRRCSSFLVPTNSSLSWCNFVQAFKRVVSIFAQEQYMVRARFAASFALLYCLSHEQFGYAVIQTQEWKESVSFRAVDFPSGSDTFSIVVMGEVRLC
jgi:hypothetical protein